MSGYKDKVTKGEWTIAVSADHTPLIMAPGSNIGVAFIPFQRCTQSRQALVEETEANAQLIAEAGTVLHETGYTPRELAEQRAELLAVCRQAIAALKGREHDGFLRDAIAKCEGGAR